MGPLMYLLGGFAALVGFVTVAGSSGDAALSKEFAWQFRLAARLRTPVLMFIVVPLSFFRWLRTTLKSKWLRLTRTADPAVAQAAHAARVEVAAAQLRAWNADGRQRTLRTARPNYLSMSTKLGSNKGDSYRIQTGHLNRILSIDVDNLRITAEPGVTMGEITEELMPLGLTLQTHIEMEAITIGGLSMGFGIETNSHRHGLFQESVVACAAAQFGAIFAQFLRSSASHAPHPAPPPAPGTSCSTPGATCSTSPPRAIRTSSARCRGRTVPLASSPR